MTLVILCRQIDISIGSIFSVCGVVAGLLARSGLPMALVGLGALTAGGALGSINGVLVARLGLPSIVVTLANLVIWRESLRYLRRVNSYVGCRRIFSGSAWVRGPGSGWWLRLPLVFGAFAWGLRNLSVGRVIYATGSDPEAARLVGIRPRRVVFAVFVIMGALSGLAALLNALRFADVDPNAGLGLELQVIAAVVVGGVAVTGGRGNLVGTLLGVASSDRSRRAGFPGNQSSSCVSGGQAPVGESRSRA